jgi:hypothetical protein
MKFSVKAYEFLDLEDALTNPVKLDAYLEDNPANIIINDFNKLLGLGKIEEVISLIGNNLIDNDLSEALGSVEKMDTYLEINSAFKIIKDYKQLKGAPLNRENIEKAIKLLQELLGG